MISGCLYVAAKERVQTIEPQGFLVEEAYQSVGGV
ncbi:hypothetical protein V6Z11_A03G140400 [Gossypium hirsutum]